MYFCIGFLIHAMRRKLFILTFLLLACLTGRAQSFRFLTSDNELPSSMINDLFQDHYGFAPRMASFASTGRAT